MKTTNFKLAIIFTILLVFGIGSKVHAQEMSSSSAEITTVTKVDYQLAYPGLLPDHSLYPLKAIRDRVNAFFISNPVKKANFDLLQADKRVGASLFLVQKNKIDLGQSTFSKAMNYFEDGISRATDAKTQGVNVRELAKKLVIANLKHQEVLNSIKTQINSKNKKKFEVEQMRLIEFEKRAKELSK